MNINPEDYVDLDRLTARLEKEGKFVLQEWTATAHEVAPKAYREISRHYSIYNELTESELKAFRYRSFIVHLLELMPGDTERRSLVAAMAIAEMKQPSKSN